MNNESNDEIVIMQFNSIVKPFKPPIIKGVLFATVIALLIYFITVFEALGIPSLVINMVIGLIFILPVSLFIRQLFVDKMLNMREAYKLTNKRIIINVKYPNISSLSMNYGHLRSLKVHESKTGSDFGTISLDYLSESGEIKTVELKNIQNLKDVSSKINEFSSLTGSNKF